jgi:predicted flap endonuclease-1-like 5' DNA nuclease
MVVSAKTGVLMEKKTKPVQARRGDLLGLEFLKWLCLLGGIVGFIAWLGDIIYWNTLGRAINPLFEMKIGSIPLVLILFSGILILGCAIAALEKYLETRSTSQVPQFDAMEKTLSEVHKYLFETTENLESTLSKAKGSNEELEAQVHVLARERDKLGDRLKVAEARLGHALAPDLRDVKGIGPKNIEKLKKMGLEKVPDLLNTDPEELSGKLKVSQKVVDKWFAEAVRISKKMM